MLPTLQSAHAIRALSMDAIQQANSGHPGAPMGMAEMATILWQNHLNHNPNNPRFPNRDRFILSNGHASMLLYSLLHLTGYDLSLDEIKNFRQLGAKTAGHPEYGMIPGIETTTGPLGQGIGNAVGMALAEKMMAAQFNREGHPLIDHYTYTFLGDGCLMEGVSHEVCSLAGTLKLNKLIVFYDDNGISIDGEIKGWFTDDTAKRFKAYGWHVIAKVDGHNYQELNQAIIEAKKSDKPTLIMCQTLIGKGAATKEGSASTHGAPLGEEEIAATKKALGWNYGPFEIPEAIYEAWDARAKGEALEKAWNERFTRYEKAYPELAQEFRRRQTGELPKEFNDLLANALKEADSQAESIATRVASQKALDALCLNLPEIVGGSADLTPSNNTFFKGSTPFDVESGQGNYIHYGVREFGMSTILNGLGLYGGFIPYGATFLVFTDYARNAIRLSAMEKNRVIYIMTHDSIGLGEDGPTHQPIEHLASLRLIPNLNVWRPCDTVETMVAWGHALTSKEHPSLLALSRQGLPCQKRTEEMIANIQKGGYVLKEVDNAQLTLIATGSEVSLAMEVASELPRVRVVSMPSVEVFREQNDDYKAQVLAKSPGRKTLAIEAGSTYGWYEFADQVIGIDTFGESAPGDELFKHFGFTKENVIKVIQSL